MDSLRSSAYNVGTTLAPRPLNDSFAEDNQTTLTKPQCVFSKYEFVGYFFIQPIICMLGAVLNFISFCIFYRGKQFKASPTYRLMMVLALFDGLTLLLTLPSSFIRCKPYLDICDSEVFKKIRTSIFSMQLLAVYPLVNMCEAVSVSITVLLSIERYISIKYHYIIKAYFSPANVRNLVLLVILVCLILNVPLVFVQYVEPVYSNVTIQDFNDSAAVNDSSIAFNNSSPVVTQRGKLLFYQGHLTSFGSSKLYAIYTWARIAIYNFLPLIFLAVINAFLIYIVRSSGHFRKQSSQTRSAERRLKGQRNLTILLVIVIFLFLAGQIPMAFAFRAVFYLFTGCPMDDLCCFRFNEYRITVQNINLLTYGANFFVYLALNKHFRAEVCRLCRCWKQRWLNGAATTDFGGEAVEMIPRKDRDKAVTEITEGNGDIEANNGGHSSEES